MRRLRARADGTYRFVVTVACPTPPPDPTDPRPWDHCHCWDDVIGPCCWCGYTGSHPFAWLFGQHARCRWPRWTWVRRLRARIPEH